MVTLYIVTVYYFFCLTVLKVAFHFLAAFNGRILFNLYFNYACHFFVITFLPVLSC